MTWTSLFFTNTPPQPRKGTPLRQVPALPRTLGDGEGFCAGRFVPIHLSAMPHAGSTTRARTPNPCSSLRAGSGAAGPARPGGAAPMPTRPARRAQRRVPGAGTSSHAPGGPRGLPSRRLPAAPGRDGGGEGSSGAKILSLSLQNSAPLLQFGGARGPGSSADSRWSPLRRPRPALRGLAGQDGGSGRAARGEEGSRPRRGAAHLPSGRFMPVSAAAAAAGGRRRLCLRLQPLSRGAAAAAAAARSCSTVTDSRFLMPGRRRRRRQRAAAGAAAPLALPLALPCAAPRPAGPRPAPLVLASPRPSPPVPASAPPAPPQPPLASTSAGPRRHLRCGHGAGGHLARVRRAPGPGAGRAGHPLEHRGTGRPWLSGRCPAAEGGVSSG